jgi:ribosomal protein S18 acetylase RimI-like enzyme
MPVVRTLFREYEQGLGIDLCFQGFEEELASLPGRYAPPSGALILAILDGEVGGCGALRDLGDGICELKRIYVPPQFRGRGLGRAISVELMRLAKAKGYMTARLDTLARLLPAVALYRDLGFEEIQAYNFNPEADIIYMERPL